MGMIEYSFNIVHEYSLMGMIEYSFNIVHEYSFNNGHDWIFI